MNENNLYFTNPELRIEWDGNIEDMKKYSFKSDSKVNWKCKSDKICHKWITSIRNRVRGNTGCPYCSVPVKTICSIQGCWCNSLWSLKPELRSEWDGNIEDMKKLSSSSNQVVKWKCKTGKDCHKYEASITHKSGRNQGCPYCINKKICSKEGCWCNSLWALKPELINEWDGNIEDMKKISISSNKDVKWKCKTTKECHKWTAVICSRNKSGCPYCSNKKICSKESCWCNSLWSLKPELRTEWFGNMDDMKLYPLHSGDKVKWKCKTNKDCHIYESRISDRTRIEGTTNCPYCCVPVKKICSKEGCWCNSLWKTNPELKEIYDGDINDLKKYTNGSEIKIKLKCKSGKECHKWYSTINHQTGLNSRGCPYCINKTEQKIYDKIITFYPLIKQQYKIEWCKNKTYLPFDFVLENDKIIIELDGIQHFEQISNWTSPEETHINDKYKMKCANNNSFSVIRLLQSDVFYDTYNWLEELKTNIEKIKNENIVQNIYMCKDNEYEIFQNL